MERTLLRLPGAPTTPREAEHQRQRRGAFQDMRTTHRRALGNAITELEGIAGTAERTAQALREALENNDNVQVQAQVNFMLGAFARLIKDQGVIEHMQALRNQKAKLRAAQ